MAILIPNTEMPKSCSDCPCEYDFIRCNLTDTSFFDSAMGYMFDFLKERLVDCPLVCIPDEFITGEKE